MPEGYDPFLSPECRSDTIDIYGPRQGVLNALRAQLPNFHGVLLDIGCGRMPYKPLLMSEPARIAKYVGVDLGRDEYGLPDVLWDGVRLPINSSHIDCIIATEVFEHCPDPLLILREIARVLKPGGMLFFTVPFLWPLHNAPHDEYRFTPFAIERLVREAGFARVTTQATGGWDAGLAQMIGLWVRRRPLNRHLRRLLSIACLPLVRFLFRLDSPPTVWREQTMLTGMSGIAFKASN